MSSRIKFTEKDLVVGLVALVGGMISGPAIALPIEVFFGIPDVMVGLIEEPAKVIGLIIIALVLPDWLTSKSKCAFFGGLAGLGFAVEENVWYYLSDLAVEGVMYWDVIIGRTILSLPTHILDSAIVGMGLLYVAAKGRAGYKKAFGFLFIAVILHGLWNAVPPVLGWYILLLMMEVTVFGCIYYKSEDYPIPPGQIGILRLLFSNREILITRNAKIFGRTDFEKDVPYDKLLLISKDHFRIMRNGDKFYIEDCNSKGGTKLNGFEIRGAGMQELNAGSGITLPGDVKIEFTTKANMDKIEIGMTLYEKPSIESISMASKQLAKLVLPDNQEIRIKEEKRVFGRGDFRDFIPDEKFRHISRRHFKITRENDDFYITDLNSKNGTMLNGEEIKNIGSRKLEDEDEILIAKMLKIRYVRVQPSKEGGKVNDSTRIHG